MGYSLIWIAVRGKPVDRVRAELNLRPTGQREQIPEAPFTAAYLADGWYVIVSNSFDETLIAESMLVRLSVACDVITCVVEEHAMYSGASHWNNGRKRWTVHHSPGKELKALGDLPPAFAAIRERLLKEQKTTSADCLFDAPIELAREITGFRHNIEMVGSGGVPPFEVLAKLPPPKKARSKSLLNRLLGR